MRKPGGSGPISRKLPGPVHFRTDPARVMTDSTASPESLLSRLDQTLLADRHVLRRLYHELRKHPDEQRQRQWLARFQASLAAVDARRQSVPPLRYDEQLPIAAKREAIRAALLQHQVLVVAGETGSGKTTQLPKICLEAGRGILGMIGHTQPRRLAARSVATRVAEELGSPLGDRVGYQVRFTDQSGPQTLVKLMTDGILLAETRHDRFLERYDTLIVDEAHERSLNIDFLLGFLKTLLPRRPDLKLIITSATIDLERFSRHFGDAPVIEVSGRTWPVDTWYRPLAAELDENGEPLMDDLSVEQGIQAALSEIDGHERQTGQRPGDVLVFLPGEREIREVAEVLRRASLRFTEVLPLYARLTPAEQQKIFQPRPARKIVLATNVAETSLTVPGIRYVIDTGVARISRYSYRAKVQRLPVEAIAQASADQRKGRCGRIGPGICIRLYSEADFLGRPAFTDPEILRTNLAAVILQMLHLRLGRIEDFPFIEPPDGRAIKDGFTLLQELSAVTASGQLTVLGQQLARLPVDPRLGRMLLEGHQQGSLEDMLIVTSALSVQDPRERPVERQQAADQAHARWKDPDSDFAVLINLWQEFETQRQVLGSNALRNWCRTHFLNYLRMREWRDAHRQLLLLCRELKLVTVAGPAAPDEARAQALTTDIRVNAGLARQQENREAGQRARNYAAVHKAILAGLLSQIGQKTEEGDYSGARQRRFRVHPGSVLGRRKPNWLMAAELVETSQLFARMVARIEPDWIEPLATHLVKKTWLEPHWEKKRGQVVAFEQVSLYGLIIVGRRRVHYGPHDPQLARELFIREGLVRGEILSQARCLAANRALLEQLDELEAKARRRDILADEETLYRYYEARIPADICQTASFDRWYRRESARQPDLLLMREEDVLARDAREVTPLQYPDSLVLDGVSLPLLYHFEPGHPRDGVTLQVPVPLLSRLPAGRLEWLVPGLLEARAVALVRNLPKNLRKNFVPVPDFVAAALKRLTFAEGSLAAALGHELQRMTGVRVPAEAWSEADAQLDDHLKMNIEVLDADGQPLGEGRELSGLVSRFAGAAQAVLVPLSDTTSMASLPVEARTFAGVPETVSQPVAGLSLTVYPALTDSEEGVREKRFPTRDEADYQHRRALQRLLLQQLAAQAAVLRKKLPGVTEMGLLYRDLGRVDSLVEDILLASLDSALLDGEDALPRSGEALAALAGRRLAQWAPQAQVLAALVLEILKRHHALQKHFRGRIDLALAMTLNDVRTQLAGLVYPGFVRETPLVWLKELPRYLQAAALRLERAAAQIPRERMLTQELAGYREQYLARAEHHAAEGRHDAALLLYRWMLEEYRVSLWAQQLGTRLPVSAQRLGRQWTLVAP